MGNFLGSDNSTWGSFISYQTILNDPFLGSLTTFVVFKLLTVNIFFIKFCR